MTTRQWIVIVATVALLMGGLRLLWLGSVYRKAALAHAAHENLARTLQRMVENEGKDERELEFDFGMWVEPESESVKAKRAAHARLNQETAEYHAALKLKYERAASRPWVPLAQDPPPPKPGGEHNQPEAHQPKLRCWP
jgi:hypothetical protein